MASEAHGNVQKALDAKREAEIAAYIMRDIDLRQRNAQEKGVLAYGKKPIPRSKPNNRFLQNTLKSVDFANRTVRENEMWEKWDPKKISPDIDEEEERSAKRRRGSRRRRSPSSDESSDESSRSDTGSDEGEHANIDKRLQAGNARGRGSTGPRADETGPFLFPTDEQELQEYELLRHVRKPTMGPACPEWIRSKSEGESLPPSSLFGGPPGGASILKKKLKKDGKRKKKSKKLKKEIRKKRKKSSPVVQHSPSL